MLMAHGRHILPVCSIVSVQKHWSKLPNTECKIINQVFHKTDLGSKIKNVIPVLLAVHKNISSLLDYHSSHKLF